SESTWISRLTRTRSGSGLLRPAADLSDQEKDRIVLRVHNAFLQRNDPVVCDVDSFGAHLAAAFGDVAVAETAFVLRELAPVGRVQRVHLELGQTDKEARAREVRLVLFVVADHMADVL